MNKKILFSALSLLVGGLIATPALSDIPQNQYAQDRQDKATRNYYDSGIAYKEFGHPVYSDGSIPADDPHVKLLSWNPVVPLRRIVNTIQEGVTDQLTMLRLFSAPNIMTRSYATNKEVWVYYSLWSYVNQQDNNETLIIMDKAGRRLYKNKKPVVMVVTFNDKDIVENYNIRLLRVKNDQFNSQ